MDDQNANVRELTFGEKAVGLTFNPSQITEVDVIKKKCADLIDELHQQRLKVSGDKGRMYSIAITEIQSAQMWAVKAATWKD